VPEFVDTVLLSSHDTPRQEYIIFNNLATLLWLGQITDIELHTWFSRVKLGPDFEADESAPDAEADYYTGYPDFIIFDIDPCIYSGNEAARAELELNREAFSKTCQVALRLRQILESLSFPSFVKTSGRTGLHVFVPIIRKLGFHVTHSAAETINRFLAQQYPAEITVDWTVEKRTGKVFLDYNQNVRGKTLASVYSPRPRPDASVSVPLRWDELSKVYPTDFTILSVPERLAETGDLWGHVLEAKINLANMPSSIEMGDRKK
jgi:bifunctional non-homologous end joining protein LigD